MAKNILSPTERKVAKFISQQGLLTKEGKYIVALSGGADSVALLSILLALGKEVSAAHCNFHLRGDESDRDEQFCVDLCQRWGVHLHRIHFDTLTYAHQHKVSIEMAARELRYRYFAQLAQDTGADGICVAHHRDDNVETLLLNLLRGSGVDGLAAISPKNGNILRPLLCLSRQEIIDYLQTDGQDYVVDSTNLEDDALRNKIRHHLVPLLQQLNPSACDNIAQTARYLRQAKLTLDHLLSYERTACHEAPVASDADLSIIAPLCNVVKINRHQIQDAASPEFMLHRELGRYGFHGDVIDQICQAMREPAFMAMGYNQGIGKTWKNKDFMVAIDREHLLVTPLRVMDILQSEREYKIPEEGNYNIGVTHGARAAIADESVGSVPAAEIQLRIHHYPRTAHFEPSKDKHRITLDADRVSFPLTYRLTQGGDRFRPFGMTGSKLVSDYLTDHKRNVIEKRQQHVLTDKTGEIIWLMGERTSDFCKITDETKLVLEIEIRNVEC